MTIPQPIMYILSVSVLMISSVIYTYGSFLTCLSEGFTVTNSLTTVANTLYIFGYVFDILSESYKIYYKDDTNKTPIVLAIMSSITFTLSAGSYTLIAINTCMTDGWTAINITTLSGNSVYGVGCLIIVINDIIRKKRQDNNPLINRMTTPLLQHLDI